jgi:DNA-binding beta-propeller fold protein YncE
MLLAEHDMATDATSLWVTTPDGVARLDAATGAVTNLYSGTSDGGIAVSSDAAWVVDKLDRMLYQLPLEG